MKSRLHMLLAGILCISATSNDLHAQHTQVDLLAYNTKSIGERNNFSGNDTVSNKPIASWEVHSKALRLFEKDYKNVEKVNWFILDDGYLARFSTNEVLNKVYYGKKGNWIGSTQQYNESKLPKEVRHIVKSNYYDFDISTVVEINIGAKPIYYVVMHNSMELLKVRVMDREIEELERFKNGK